MLTNCSILISHLFNQHIGLLNNQYIHVLVIRNLSCKYIYICIYIKDKIKKTQFEELEFDIFYGKIKCNGDRRSDFVGRFPMQNMEEKTQFYQSDCTK